MNVFGFELKRIALRTLLWIVSIVGVLLLLMNLFYPVFTDGRNEVMSMLDGLPKQFAVAFGIQTNSIFSYEGFYTFTFLYIGLMSAIMASALTLEVFSREKRGKCLDYIFTKPVSRNRIFFAKLISVLLALVVVNIVYAALVWYGFSANITDFEIDGTFVSLAISPFLTSLFLWQFLLFWHST